MRSDAVAMAKAFSMPSADSRIGMSQMGRVMPVRCAIESIAPTTSDTCLAVSTFGMRMRSGACGTISSRSAKPSGNWLMRTMRSAAPKSTARSALRTSSRATSFSAWCTESSRSRIIASGACSPALMKYLGSLPGRYSRDRRNRSRTDGAARVTASGSADLPWPRPARRTAASIRAAITKGSAPSSTISRNACSTPSACKTSRACWRMTSP